MCPHNIVNKYKGYVQEILINQFILGKKSFLLFLANHKIRNKKNNKKKSVHAHQIDLMTIKTQSSCSLDI